MLGHMVKQGSLVLCVSLECFFRLCLVMPNW